MNCTYTRSIGCTPYELVFNRKPNYRRIASYSRAGHEISDEVLSDDDQDTALKSTISEFREEVTDAEMATMEQEMRQQMADRQLAERLQRELVEMNDEQQESSSNSSSNDDDNDKPDDWVREYPKSDGISDRRGPHTDTTKNTYQMSGALQTSDDRDQLTGVQAKAPIVITDSQQSDISSDDENGGNASQSLPKTPPNERNHEPGDVLSPSLGAMNLGAQELDSTPTTAARIRAVKYQKAAQERSIKQYGKQRRVQVYEVGQKVSVGIPREDRSSTDDKRVFGKVIQAFDEINQYQIVTQWGVLDRLCPINIVNALEPGVDVNIPEPPPSNKVALAYCAGQQSTSQKAKVKCDCKDRKKWCSNRTCKCIKAGVKCSVHCHQSQGHPDTRIECPNVAPVYEFTRMGLGTREQRQEQERVEKRQRQDAAGRWVSTKGIGFGPVDSEGNVDKEVRKAREKQRKR